MDLYASVEWRLVRCVHDYSYNFILAYVGIVNPFPSAIRAIPYHFWQKQRLRKRGKTP